MADPTGDLALALRASTQSVPHQGLVKQPHKSPMLAGLAGEVDRIQHDEMATKVQSIMQNDPCGGKMETPEEKIFYMSVWIGRLITEKLGFQKHHKALQGARLNAELALTQITDHVADQKLLQDQANYFQNERIKALEEESKSYKELLGKERGLRLKALADQVPPGNLQKLISNPSN